LIRYIEFLKTENEMLRLRIPKKRIFLKPEEKRLLLKLGNAVGPGLKDLITIVHFRTYQRWLQGKKSGKTPQKIGRPRTAQQIRELVLRIATETGWGYSRILGELKKLRVFSVSRSTIINILKANNHDPGPNRGKGSWDEFVKMHAETLWQCDFFSKRIWTAKGLRQYFVLAFLHVGSRRVFVTKACCKPDAAWMKAQARAFLEHVENSEELRIDHIIHDYDGMFINEFDDTLLGAGVKVKRVGPRAPNMNAFIERWIQSIKHEVLNHFIICGEEHFNHLISEYQEYYHTARPHQGMGNMPLTGSYAAKGDEVFDLGEIECRHRLGGLLKDYFHKAA